MSVCGHGDLHRENWYLTERGPVLLDWEDMGQFPLAYELGSFINFAHLDPIEVARCYGVSDGYAQIIERVAARGALDLHLYWLRSRLAGGTARADDLDYSASVCRRFFDG